MPPTIDEAAYRKLTSRPIVKVSLDTTQDISVPDSAARVQTGPPEGDHSWPSCYRTSTNTPHSTDMSFLQQMIRPSPFFKTYHRHQPNLPTLPHQLTNISAPQHADIVPQETASEAVEVVTLALDKYIATKNYEAAAKVPPTTTTTTTNHCRHSPAPAQRATIATTRNACYHHHYRCGCLCERCLRCCPDYTCTAACTCCSCDATLVYIAPRLGHVPYSALPPSVLPPSS